MTAPTIATVMATAAAICLVVGSWHAGQRVALGRLGVEAPARDRSRRADGGPGRLVPGARARNGRRRLAAIDAEIPQLLDLLAAGSSAGLAAPLAFSRAADGLAGPLAEEVQATVRAVSLGARWRDELELLADRLDLPDLRRAVTALTRTESLGTSLSRATAELAASVRQARRAATSERARTAPVKMLFPLVFLVLPAFLLLTVVPVLLTTVRSIG